MGQDLFSFGTIALILNNLLLDFLDPKKNDHIDCTILVKKPCGPLYFVHWHFLCSIMREKKANVLFTGKSAFFSKICVFNNLLGPNNWSYYFDINWQNIFLAHENRFLAFVTLDNSKNYRASTSLHWRDCLFSKNKCFEQPLRSPRSDLVTCTMIAKIPCGA